MKFFDNIQNNIDEEIQKNDILTYYKLMAFFLFRKFAISDNKRPAHGAEHEGEMYLKMRHYFAEGIIKLLKTYSDSDLTDKTLIDVGGATGDFCAYMTKRLKIKCLNSDLDIEKINDANFQPSVLGSGADIKQSDNKFDFVISCGVIEHVPIDQHEKFISECFRVMKPNGIGYLTSSPWYAPWARHQLSSFHIFPIKIAYLLTNLFFKKQYILIIPLNFKFNYYTRQNI